MFEEKFDVFSKLVDGLTFCLQVGSGRADSSSSMSFYRLEMFTKWVTGGAIAYEH